MVYCVVYISIHCLGWCITTRNVCVYHPFSNGTFIVTHYIMYFKLWFCHWHFIFWVGSVTSIIVSSLTSVFFIASLRMAVWVAETCRRLSIIVQQDATIYSFIIFLQTALHVSDDTFIHHQEHTQTVITTSGTRRTVFATVRWRGVGTSSDSSTSADCNYSLSVLLMMDEGIIQNM